MLTKKLYFVQNKSFNIIYLLICWQSKFGKKFFYPYLCPKGHTITPKLNFSPRCCQKWSIKFNLIISNVWCQIVLCQIVRCLIVRCQIVLQSLWPHGPPSWPPGTPLTSPLTPWPLGTPTPHLDPLGHCWRPRWPPKRLPCSLGRTWRPPMTQWNPLDVPIDPGQLTTRELQTCA